MPYPMTHMLIAWRLTEKLPWLECPQDFVLGSIAPDAVHFREGYEVHNKEASHLWHYGPAWGITTESEAWKENVLAFWNRSKTEKNRDFMAGYCTHLLTDWMNDRIIWKPFWNSRGKRTEQAEREYRFEAHEMDQWLWQVSPETAEIWRLLEQARAWPVEKCITEEELERQRRSVLTRQFIQKGRIDVSSHKFVTKDIMESFLAECVERIPKEMKL